MPNPDSPSTSPARGKRTRKNATPAPEPVAPVDDATPMEEVLPPAVSDEVVDEIVRTLNGWQRAASFAFARQVGTLILDKLYAGDVNAWRSRAQKDTSFRKLKARAEAGTLQVSAASLSRSVALVELEARLGPVDQGHLTLTHVREVFGLPADQQQKLLADARENEWSIEEMARASAELRKQESPGRGRPPLPTFVKSIHALARTVAMDDAFADIAELDQVSDADAEALWEAVAGVQRKCAMVQEALARRLPGREGLG